MYRLLVCCYRIVGTLTDVSNSQLESCEDITGNTRYPGHVGELEQMAEPVSASDLLKWSEQSREVAESIRSNEDLWCRLSAIEGRNWEGRILRLSNSVITNSFRRLRGRQRIPVVATRVITPGLERVGRQMGLDHIVIPDYAVTFSDAGCFWVISNLTHPDIGTSVQPGSGSVFCDQHDLSLLNGRVVWLQRVPDRDLESLASNTITEVRGLVMGAEESKPQSAVGGRCLDKRWLFTSHEKRLMRSLKSALLGLTKMWTRACWIPYWTVMIGVTGSGVTWFRTPAIVSLRTLARETILNAMSLAENMQHTGGDPVLRHSNFVTIKRLRREERSLHPTGGLVSGLDSGCAV